MTVYVDDMYKYPMGEFKRFGRILKMSHMIADTVDELHAMADALGLKREYYQGDHYDVSMSLRRRAIEQGAVAITLRELAHMARKPSAKKASNKAISKMVEALKFIEPASSEIGQVNQTHCMIANGWAAQFNGLIMLAHKIDTDIIVYPNTKKLLKVLERCDEAVQITQLDNGRLGVKSGKFNAYVPCIEPGLISMTGPDPVQFALNEAVLTGLQAVAVLVKENAERMVQASVLLRHSSVLATDGVAAMECWHGTPMPTVILPKVFVSLLDKIKKKPVGLGVSPTTCTVWFEDDCFIRTQLYTEQYPDIDRILNLPNNAFPLAPEFFPALVKIAALKDEQPYVYFNSAASKLQTNVDDNVGASCEYEAPLPHGISFNIDYLLKFAPYAQKADFVCGDKNQMAIFYGANFRGCLMQRLTARASAPVEVSPPQPGYAPDPMTTAYHSPGVASPYGQQPQPGAPAYISDDEIPF